MESDPYMSKKVSDTKGWFYLSLGGVIISLLSMFLPILTSYGKRYNIIDLVCGNQDFADDVIGAYTGPVLWNITSGTVIILAILAAISLILTIVGLITLRAQRPNIGNFILTFVGLIGNLLPSLTAIICVVCLQQYYPGGLGLGIAPIISPIAILVSLLAVIRRKYKIDKDIKKDAERRGLIRKAGDL